MRASTSLSFLLAVCASAVTISLGVWIWRQFFAAVEEMGTWAAQTWGADQVEVFMQFAWPCAIVFFAVSSLLMLPGVFKNKSE